MHLAVALILMTTRVDLATVVVLGSPPLGWQHCTGCGWHLDDISYPSRKLSTKDRHNEYDTSHFEAAQLGSQMAITW